MDPRSRGGFDGLRLFLRLLEVPLLYSAFRAAFWIRFHSGWLPPSGLGAPDLADYQLTFASLACGWSVFLWSGEGLGRVRFTVRGAFRLFGQLAIAWGFTLALFFFRRDFSYSRLYFALSFATAAGALGLYSWLRSRLLIGLLRRGYGRIPALVVGPEARALDCLGRLDAASAEGLDLRGYLVDADADAGPAANEPSPEAPAMARSFVAPEAGGPGDPAELAARFARLGAADDLEAVVEAEGIREVYLVYPLAAGPRALDLLRRAENTAAAVRLVPDTLGIITHGVAMRLVGGVPVFDVGRSAMQGAEGALKRAIDFAAAALGLVVISPLLAYVAWRVKRDSPGPVLYSQERVGMDGRPFTIYKFRSMRTDAEAATGPVWATKGDDRATPFGRVMRKWSIDELPQLFNVLRGDMSLVGPRPERPHFVDRFRRDIQGYMQRHRVKAGITGWAQINGLRGECPIEERTRYDVWYIENWSLWLDLEILLRTLRVVVFEPDGD